MLFSQAFGGTKGGIILIPPFWELAAVRFLLPVVQQAPHFPRSGIISGLSGRGPRSLPIKAK